MILEYENDDIKEHMLDVSYGNGNCHINIFLTSYNGLRKKTLALDFLRERSGVASMFFKFAKFSYTFSIGEKTEAGYDVGGSTLMSMLKSAGYHMVTCNDFLVGNKAKKTPYNKNGIRYIERELGYAIDVAGKTLLLKKQIAEAKSKEKKKKAKKKFAKKVKKKAEAISTSTTGASTAKVVSSFVKDIKELEDWHGIKAKDHLKHLKENLTDDVDIDDEVVYDVLKFGGKLGKRKIRL